MSSRRKPTKRGYNNMIDKNPNSSKIYNEYGRGEGSSTKMVKTNSNTSKGNSN